jgi:hypothetical protein
MTIELGSNIKLRKVIFRSFRWNYVFAVLILAIFVVALTLFYWWQVKVATRNSPEIVKSEETVQPPKPIDTSKWTTYEDKTYNFTFRHPAEWIVKQDGQRFLLFDLPTSCILGTCPTKKSEVGFGAINNDALLPVSEAVKQNVAVVGIEKDKIFSLGDFQGIKRSYQGPNGSAILVIFSKKGNLRTLYYFETSGQENERILDEMLASFKVNS